MAKRSKTPTRTRRALNLSTQSAAFFLPIILAASYLNAGPTCCGCPPPPPDFVVSKNTAGENAEGVSQSPVVSSADGNRFVFYNSVADNLYDGPGPGGSMYLRDLLTGETTRPMAWPQGVSWFATINSGGTSVVYLAREFIDPATGNGPLALIVHDVETRTDEIVGEGYTIDGLLEIAASEDVQRIAFSTEISLDAVDTNNTWDVYLKDRTTDTLTLVSDPNAGLGGWERPHLSRDGEWIAYTSRRLTSSDASVVVLQEAAPTGGGLSSFTFPGHLGHMDYPGEKVVYTQPSGPVAVFDRTTGSHQVVSIDAFGNTVDCYAGVLAGDGRFVAFHCTDPMTSHGAAEQTYVRDLQEGWIKLASIDHTGTPGSFGSWPTAMPADGSSLFMETNAFNLGGPEQIIKIPSSYWDEGSVCASNDASCDGVDDDCDGQIDEDYASQATNCGIGACAATGATSCSGGIVVNSCVPGAPAASDSMCDGVDEDCDGSVDEDAVSVQVTCQIGGCSAVAVGPCGATPNCAAVGVCIAELGCADTTDNDGDGLVDCSDSDCAASTDCANTAPTLDPVATQTVTVGEILRFTLTGSDPDGDPVTFGVTPLPLPANATLRGDTGAFTFAPTLSQLASYAFNFSASDGRDTTTQTAVITVLAPVPGGPTGVTGVLLDGEDAAVGQTTPVVGATVRDLGSAATTTTASDGSFTLTGLTPGAVTLEFDGGTAAGPISYGSYRATKTVETGTIRTLSQPVFLPHVDASSEVTVDPNNTTMLSNPSIGVDVTIPAHTVMDELGAEYTGELTLSSVPAEFTPGALPETLNPSMVVTIQPMGLTFTQPAPITFPNDLGLTPGSEVDIWSLDHSTGEFFIAGTGQVTSDGVSIVTIAGGVQESSWHFPASSGPGSSGGGDGTGDGASSDGPGGPPGPCEGELASQVSLAKGTVRVDVALPSYVVRNQPFAPTLVYSTARAFPNPLVPVNAFTVKRFAVPDVISYSTRIGGASQSNERFVDTTGLSETVDEPFRVVVPINATGIATSVLPLEVWLTSHYGDSSVSTVVNEQVPVVGGLESPFGVGWGWDGLAHLVAVGDSGLDRLLVDGNGAYRLFTYDNGQLVSPSGDASELIVNGDGTAVLTRTDGVETYFATDGKQDQVVFPNGNTWSYSYDAQDRLSEVIDPTNGTTTLIYSSGKLSVVTDPASRSTTFEHDASGHLIRVNFPDASTRQFGYDSRHLMTSETDQRGFTKHRKFDFTGRLREVVLEDTSSRFISPAATQGVLDPASGIGLSKANPAPIVLPSVTTTTVDAEGRAQTYEFTPYGTAKRFVDAASLATVFEHDQDGNVIRITRPNGEDRSMTYDANNNLLTETDEVLGGTTQYTYDPVLNRLQTITDAALETTTLGYDGFGQLTTITTPLQREVTLTYTPDGKLDTLNGPLGAQVMFDYDAAGNMIQITRSADAQSRITSFTNDATGSLATQTDATNRTTTFTRDSMNRLTSVQGPGAPVTQLGYDAEGNATIVTPPSRPPHRFEYDERDWLASYSPPALSGQETPTTFARNREGQVENMTLADSRSVVDTYDTAGRLVTTAIQRGTYTRDYNETTGQVRQMVDPNGGTLNFLYDGDRLRGTVSDAGNSVFYTSDPMGRLDSMRVLTFPGGAGDPSSMIARWPADGNLVDPVGGFDAILDAGVSYVAGIDGQAFSFDGQDDGLRVNVPLDGRSNVTFALWFRMSPGTNAGGERLLWLRRRNGFTDFELKTEIGGDDLRATFMSFYDVILPSDVTYDDGQWHHVVVTMELVSTNLHFQLYFDGLEADANLTSSFGSFDTAGDLLIGGVGLQRFEGGMDDLTIYDRTLSPEEINQLYAESDDQIDYAYDADGAMTQAGDVSMGYDAATGLLATKTLDQVTTTLGRNGFGDITSESTEAVGAPSPVYEVTYTRDPIGRVSEKTETLSGQSKTLKYVYDEVGRLIEVLNENDVTIEEYTYDLNDNRLTADTGSGSVSASYDAQDRLTQYGSNQYAYRDSGELFEKTHPTDGTTTYDYDELGNLLSVVLPGGSVVEYEIDAMNRRVGRKIDGQVTNRWVYKDQLNPVAELDESGALVSLFIYGTRSHVPDAMVKDGVPYLFVTDQVGSVRQVVNAETGAVVQSIDYDAWGNVVSDSSPGFQPFGFAGGLYDGQTKLVRFGARDYDPEVGRWTAKDPILFDGGQGNLYGYVKGDPVNTFDPAGLHRNCGLGFLSCLGCIGSIALGSVFGAAVGCATCGGNWEPCGPPDEPICSGTLPPGCRFRGPGTGPGNPCQVICPPICEPEGPFHRRVGQ